MLKIFYFLLLVSFSALAFANDTETNSSDPFQILITKPASLLGQSVKEIISLFGSPDEVFVQRGDTAEADDVVFFYKTYFFYLFFSSSRVWAIRFDRRFPEKFFNLQMGQKKEEVFKILNAPYQTYQDSFIFFLPSSRFPLRLRLIFEKDQLIDFYLYRGDF